MKNKKEKFIWIILIVASTAFSFAMGEGNRNLLLIGIMGVVPFLLFFQCPGIKSDEFLIFTLAFFILFCGLCHYDTFRVSSVMYSYMFIITFIYYKRLLYANVLEIHRYLLILKLILKAYFVVLIIQQFCAAVNLPVFNSINYLGMEDAFKLNSLAPEPSHTARILILLMYSYVCIEELLLGRNYDFKKDWKKDWHVWLYFLYPMFTMGSGSAFIFLAVFLLKFVRRKNIPYIIMLVIGCIVVLSELDLVAVNRAIAFSQAAFTFDVDKMIDADHSASIRAVPIVLYLKMFNIYDLNSWLGFGIDYSVKLFNRLIPGIPDGVGAGGMFPCFIVDYGIITGFVLFLFINKFCFKKLMSFDFLIWAIAITTSDFNTQIVWLSFILLATNKYYFKKTI